jgi:hypothetical protein
LTVPAAENAGSYAEMLHAYDQLRTITAELASAGRLTRERDRRLSDVKLRLAAAAPLADLADLVAGDDFGSRPAREAY